MADLSPQEREASYVRFATQVRRLLYAFTLIVVVGVIATVWLFQRQQDLSKRNAQAIEVGCTLIANSITQAGAAAGREGTSVGAAKQRAITLLAYDVIQRHMTPAELATLHRLNRELEEAGPIVTVPDCEQVARAPEKVKQSGDPTAQQRP